LSKNVSLQSLSGKCTERGAFLVKSEAVFLIKRARQKSASIAQMAGAVPFVNSLSVVKSFEISLKKLQPA